MAAAKNLDWRKDLLVFSSTLSSRQKLVARLIYEGRTDSAIADEIGYTESKVRTMRTCPHIRDEVNLLRDAYVGLSPMEQLKRLSDDSIKIIAKTIKAKDSDISISPRLKLKAVMWLIDKATGKAVPQTEVGPQLNFSHLLEEIKKMRASRDKS